ncbi:MAG: AI-2E family transporter, partial [Rhodobacterales bacterium]|nr:AI-2E family transporter [Rhodobacterales bacterium]MDX5414600.1 AI-2E family transporter [Rhodobacterales bacterium]
MVDSGAGHGRRNLLVVIAVILTGWALRATGSFMVPVVFSMILALLIAPIDRWVSQRMPHRLSWLGHVASMGVIVLVLAAFAGAMWFAAQQTIARFPGDAGDGSLLPQWGAEVLQGANGSGSQGAGAAEPSSPDGPGTTGAAATGSSGTGVAGNVRQWGEYLSGMGDSLIRRLGEWATGYAAQILSMAGATLSAIVLVFFLTLIMMIEGTEWRLKVGAIMDSSAREKTLDSISIIADRLRRYLLARVVLGIVTAALYAGWLWIFGIDLLVVWALIVFLLGFIPTFGSLIAGILPVIYAFVQKDFTTAMG